VRAWWSHTTTTVFVGGLMAVVATLGMLAFSESIAIRAAADLSIVVVVTVYLWLPGRISSRRDTEAARAG
jgi:predicted negative regulator of RcsB-dependent stress response